jgi:peptidoglycan/xylan/chitin deacetylase (PgdA/CDA1 family)
MNARFVRALCGSAYHGGLLSAVMAITEPLNGSKTAGRFQILVYHRVADDGDPFVPATSVTTFERHIHYLRNHWTILSLTDLLAAAQRREVPPRAIAVTFDDGYEDTYRHVDPIVRHYEVPITVFLAAGLMDSDCPIWNDRVGTAIRDTSCTRMDGVPGCEPLPLTTTVEREHALDRILRTIKARRPAEREELTRQISRALRVPPDRGPRMLRWRQVKEMQAHGIEFGAHTVDHPILTAVPPAEQWQQIIGSKRVIEERLQVPVTHFAYPNGKAADFDETTKALVKKAGFSAAVSMIFGTNTPETDPYELRRGGAWEEAIALFAAKLWWHRRGRITARGTSNPQPATSNQ